MPTYIYQIRHKTTDKKYIGSSQTFPTKRWTEHMLALKHGYHKNELFVALWNGDFREWEFSILEVLEKETGKALLWKEAEHILKVSETLRLNTPNRTVMTKERNEKILTLVREGKNYDFIKDATGVSKSLISQIKHQALQ